MSCSSVIYKNTLQFPKDTSSIAQTSQSMQTNYNPNSDFIVRYIDIYTCVSIYIINYHVINVK